MYILYYMAVVNSVSPSPLNSFHKNTSQKQKSPHSPHGEQGQKIHFCGTTLFAGKSGHFRNGANTPSAFNAGITSADTQGLPFSLCPRRPICCSAFRSALSTRNSLWMRYAALLPLRWFQDMIRRLYIICVRLSRTFFFAWRTFLGKGYH